ncbi:hypothetical protein Syun_008406 [Stephania yunnanensis]|uniref:DUF1771 domain-containing protein n=1 Tax=Stephania yunnanensis TaxID=152371 RepID=A0AAP0PN47_9MAGN
MEGLSSTCGVEYDEEAKVLGELLDLFGSAFSLKEIASAYCEAGRDGNVAANILCRSQECGSKPGSGLVSSEVSINGVSMTQEKSEVMLEKRNYGSRGGIGSKTKRVSVSLGTVSSVIGKDYSKPTVLHNGKCETTKPVKLNLDEFPVTELWGEDESLDSTMSKERMHHEMEDFLQKMLGNGYKLGMDVIREVLGCCGFDMKKSMEKLLDISASRTLNKCDDIVDCSAENSIGNISRPESRLNTENLQQMDISPSNETKPPTQDQDKERYDLPKELLASLFSVSKRFEKSPPKSRTVRQKKTVRIKHGMVVPPGTHSTADLSAEIVETQKEEEKEEDDADEEVYHVLRSAAKAHWITMKEYYKAATDAYAEGDLGLASKLLEQGQLYNEKAREADKKSAEMILEESKKENRDQVTLDLHGHDTKEALKLVKYHLTRLSGIRVFSYLKLTVKTEGIQKRWVLKLLEKESINWTEEGNGGTILIRIDEINPQKLSFAKKAR